jgi:hypothetical protein
MLSLKLGNSLLSSSYKLGSIRFVSSPSSALDTNKLLDSNYFEHHFFVILDFFEASKASKLGEMINNLKEEDSYDAHVVKLKVFLAQKHEKKSSNSQLTDAQKASLSACILLLKDTSRQLFDHITNVNEIQKVWTEIQKLASTLKKEYDSSLINDSSKVPLMKKDEVSTFVEEVTKYIKKKGIIISFKGSPFEVSSGQSLPPQFNSSNQDLEKHIRVINLSSYSDTDLLKQFPVKVKEKPLKTENPTGSSSQQIKSKKKD